MANRYWAKGSLLQRKNPTTQAWQTVENARTLAGPSMQADRIEVSDHSSPSNFKEYVGSWLDGGQVTADVAWDPGDSVHAALRDDYVSRATRTFRIRGTDPAPHYLVFQGQVTNLGHDFQTTEVMQRSLEVSITGEVKENTTGEL